MKSIAEGLIRFINKCLLALSIGTSVHGNRFFLARIVCPRGNRLGLHGSTLRRSRIALDGERNVLEATDAYLEGADILLRGSGNSLKIAPGVKLHRVNVIIRGNDCSISIGTDSSMAGGRIVIVGNDCSVDIGRDCMFSDHVEIWASDTHPIFDESDLILNREAPIQIGDHVWIGSRVSVLKGVRIGRGSVIGTGAVVTSDVPAGSISAGNPNRILRENIRWAKYYPGQSGASRGGA